MDCTIFRVLTVLAYIVVVVVVSLASADIDVLEQGAVGDGLTDDVQAFLAAWTAACNHPGSPRIIVPQGRTFLLSTTTFEGPCKSPIHIQIDGTILAPSQVWSLDTTKWLRFKGTRSLTVDGSGTIDGNGGIWWSCRANKQCHNAPDTLDFDNCGDISISGLTFVNSPKKHLGIYKTNGAVLNQLVITAPKDSPNTDGVHIQESQYVQVLNSNIGTGDDCVSIGSGTSYVNVSNVKCGPGHGISIGSLGADGREATVEKVFVSSCDLSGTTNGVRIKTWQGGSGFARGIIFQDINFNNVKNPIIIDQFYCDKSHTHDCPNKASAVQVSDIQYIGARGYSANNIAINLKCSETYPCRSIAMDNIHIQSSGGGEAEAYCMNAEGTKRAEVIPEVPCLRKM